MKPIETIYNGYRFRSRLEARWAVFFDVLGVTYQYEPEGFDIGGEWYLPDFYLPRLETYVEIKPLPDSGIKNEWKWTCHKFQRSTGYNIILCSGSPSDTVFKKFYCAETDSVGINALFCTDHASDLHIALHEDSNVRFVNDRIGVLPMDSARDQNMPIEMCYPPKTLFDEARFQSRQARFEHGEKGYWL